MIILKERIDKFERTNLKVDNLEYFKFGAFSACTLFKKAAVNTRAVGQKLQGIICSVYTIFCMKSAQIPKLKWLFLTC